MNEEQARVLSTRNLLKVAPVLKPHLLSKSWILYGAPQQHAFYISDNPVTMNKTLNKDLLPGTLGLRVPGIEIYLPLSRHLCLGFLCPTIEARFRDGQKIQWIKALDGHEALALIPENVTFLNSLQVISAERHVYSSNDDFSLVREMLQSHTALRGGNRYPRA